MIYSILAFVAKRLVNNGLLVLSTAFGLLVTVTLVTAIPLYSEGISEFLLKVELAKPDPRRIQPRSSVLLRHFDRSTAGELPTSRQLYEEADAFFGSYLDDLIGLPELQQVSYLQTDVMPLLAYGDSTHTSLRRRDLSYGFFFNMTGIMDNIEIIEGRAPDPEVTMVPDGAGGQMPMFETMMITEALDNFGLLIGEQVKVVFEDPVTGEEHLLGAKVVGRWVPIDPRSPYWIYNAETAFDNGAMYVDRDVYLGDLVEKYPEIFHEATWYSNFDANEIKATNYERITGGLYTLRASTNVIFPGTKLEVSPEETFFQFDQKLFFLKLLLFILSAPIIAIVLYYISLSAGMVVDRQRNEIATLKSRGVGTWQIVGVYILEGVLVGAVAMIIGPILATHVAQIIGKTYTFLVFTNREDLPMALNGQHYLFAAGAVALSIAATLGPAISAARQSIVTYKQDVSRATRPPVYQRYFLDLLLLAVAIYGFISLRSRDSLLSLGPEGQLFSDPLMLVAPVVFIFAVALVFLRFFPFIVSGIAFLGSRFYGVGIHLGLRQISRSPGQFIRLVLLLILTFALGTFSASMAATIDRNINDRILFRVGGDAYFNETGIWDENGQLWLISPADRHYELLADNGEPAIEQVARLWHSEASFQIPGRGGSEKITVYGVDPIPFANTVWWRDDFSTFTLNALMNSLALDERALLADRAFFQEGLLLRIGDPVRFNIAQNEIEFFIAGWIDIFPTHYPDEGPFVVTNVDFIHRNFGESPWDIIATLSPGQTASEIGNRLRDLDINIVDATDATAEILETRTDATQTGTFGILSIGFLISTVLTLLGFLTYSFISFRRRLQEFGILRAMGLSVRQMITLFLFENGFLILLGTVVGTLLGILTGTMFIPFLQLSADQLANTPAFIVETAWGDIARIFVLFGIVLAVAFPFSVWMLRRIRIHEAMKFGDEAG
jgi:putative ABC transport system permease protein